MRMTVEQIQNRLVDYMEKMGSDVKGIKGIFTYFGLVFLLKTKLKEMIENLDKGGMLQQFGIINADGVDVDLLADAADYLIPKMPEKIEVGEFVFSHSDLAGFFKTLKGDIDE